MTQLNIPNLDRLISHLEGLPEEKFDMRSFYTDADGGGSSGRLRGKVQHTCGTAACIAGWIFELDLSIKVDTEIAGRWIGVNSAAAYHLFQPPSYYDEGQYPLSRAIRTLKHMRAEFLRTGQVVVDWDAPEPAARKTWVAPQAVERVLPIEITKLLTPSLRAEVL